MKKILLAFTFTCFSSSAFALPIASFLIDGDTFTSPFSFSNTSTAGEEILRFNLDLTGTGLAFDTVTGGTPGNGTIGVPFTPLGGTDTTTGLTAPASVVDGATILDLFFNDFQSGETFTWDIDVDGDAGSGGVPITVTGDLLIGASVFVDFSDGQRVFGSLEAVAGNPDASKFEIAGIIPTAAPEPSIIALLAAGLVGIGFARRRQS